MSATDPGMTLLMAVKYVTSNPLTKLTRLLSIEVVVLRIGADPAAGVKTIHTLWRSPHPPGISPCLSAAHGPKGFSFRTKDETVIWP